MNHRWGRRRATNVSVRFVTMPGTTGSGRILNISSTGAFMETTLPLRLLSLVYLEPGDRVPAAGMSGRIAATVVRRDEAGYGLEWCEFGAETTLAFARLTADADQSLHSQLSLLPSAEPRSASLQP